MSNSITTIRAENDALRKDIASVRLLLAETSKKSNMNALAYKILMDHVALKLAMTQGHCYNIESACAGATVDNDMEVTADDLPFQ